MGDMYIEEIKCYAAEAVEIGNVVETRDSTTIGLAFPKVYKAGADLPTESGLVLGVAMSAGAVGDYISVRLWYAGTCSTKVDLDGAMYPGSLLYLKDSTNGGTAGELTPVQGIGGKEPVAIALELGNQGSHARYEVMFVRVQLAA